MRLIDADALIESLSINPEDCPGCPEPEWLEELACVLALAPTVERKKGKWIDDCTCSICHWIHDDEEGFALLTNYHFCPNCGADMRGRTDGQT